ncbi:transcription termination/antitermination NusG family protein [Pleomorphochaeta sp. DL1XJH-081]|jgi:transcriptional antiterminator NusG|uniref:transcription termination/antitermination NusG family protein n=1 Tax=Pleomorphochaeta sp. DL1XJH-081 TaxID=3409690 RepID=UPI003BB7FD3E
MKAYCLYCKTGAEAKLVKLLKKDMRDYFDMELEVIYPTRLMNQRKQGQWKRVEQPLLPGYVFIYLQDEIPFPLFIIRQEREAYKILRNPDNTMELRSGDMQYAMWVYNHGGKFVPSTVVFKHGQIVKVLDGPLKDMEGRIVKLDRHHKRVVVGFMFAGSERRVNLSINVIDATEEEEKPRG